MFSVEDDFHAEPQGEYCSLEEALAELRRRAKLPWDAPPNAAPCTNWRHCGRNYVVIQYDTSQVPWIVVERRPVLEVSAEGIKWVPEFDPNT
jgi:hypothetical protein